MFHVNTTEYDEMRGPAVKNEVGAAARRHSAVQASIEQAKLALWPDGVPPGIPVKARDQRINDWQRQHGIAVASSKSISRYLAEHSS
jgi:hypothetical protein